MACLVIISKASYSTQRVFLDLCIAQGIPVSTQSLSCWKLLYHADSPSMAWDAWTGVTG